MLIGAQYEITRNFNHKLLRIKSVLHDTKTARIILADGYTPLSQKRYSPATFAYAATAAAIDCRGQ
jgi:hypothetical protein